MTSAAWEYSVGLLPHRVVAYEDTARRGVLYLRWRVAGDWKRKSLGFAFVRDAKGRIPKAQQERAQRDADAQYARLLSGGLVPAAPTAALTIKAGWALATDPERGKWIEDTMHRREMDRAIRRAKSVWGTDTTWNAIDRGEVRRLWRAELKRVKATGRPGVRSAEIIVARVMALATWLRDEGKIASTACLSWKAMKEDMAKDFKAYTPKRLRYSLQEYRAILTAAPSVDPRFGLLLQLGAEYRLGQVVRCHRSALSVGDTGTLRIAGSGKKGGTTVVLTDAQTAAAYDELTVGYLAGLESAYQTKQIDDYPLFPGVRLPKHDGVPYTRIDHATRPSMGANHQLRTWLRATEAKARVDDQPIPHITGRGWYGLRRIAVDAAKESGISREGLGASGGWANTQVPDAIYAEQEMAWAAKEAADIRAKIRGEIPRQTDQNGTCTQNGTAEAMPPSSPKRL